MSDQPIPVKNEDTEPKPPVPDAPEVPKVPPKPHAPTFFQRIRLAYILLVFVFGCLSIVASQFIISVLFVGDEARMKKLTRFTKQSFVILLIYVTNKVSPTEVIVTFDDSPALKDVVKHEQVKGKDRYSLQLDSHAVVISNHQIYNDWVFIWFLAYLNRCADQIFIVMKKSLRKIPIIGWGMANYNFIFLSRNWASDREYMYRQFQKIATLGSKCWLLIFPEGTNMSPNTIEKSNAFAAKTGEEPTKYVLLPRARGLYLSCKTLGKTTNTLYDLTIGYSGHSAEEMAQDIYTLRSIYLLGRGPKTVSIHISAVDLHHDIPDVDFTGEAKEPLTTEAEDQEIDKFSGWLARLWRKKETWMAYYYSTGHFPTTNSKEYRVQLKLNSRLEIVNVFIIPVLTVVFVVLIHLLFSQLLGLVMPTEY